MAQGDKTDSTTPPASSPRDWRNRRTVTTQEITAVAEPVAADSATIVGVLTVLAGPDLGAVHALRSGEVVLGRAPDIAISLAGAGVSRRHARFSHVDGAYYVEDLGSTNGTYLDGVRITARTPLFDGARVQVGEATVLGFSLQDALQQEAARKLYEMTVRDALTGLHNRRYIEERLQGEYSFSVRHRTALALMLVDADHFKQINDAHGHLGGDEVLRALATRLKHTLRAEDAVARFGGEEFLVMARGIDAPGSATLAERLRANMERTTIQLGASSVRFTVSIGVAHHSPSNPYGGVEAMIAAADGALYLAKRKGRNRVVFAERDPAGGGRPNDDTLKTD